MTYMRAALYVTSALTALAASVPAFAADAASGAAVQQPSEAPAETANTNDERIIIVTAQKREQTLIEVPQAVSVVSGTSLEQQQANSFSDYLKLVPGLQLNQSTPGEGRLIIRGVNTGGVSST